MEYRSLDDPTAGWHGLTRSPIDFAEPILGKAEARAFVEQADREWVEGGASWNTDWVVRGGEYPPAEKARPVGWGCCLIAHALVFTICVALYIPAWLDNEHFTPEGDAYLGTSRGWGFIFLMLPIGLPGSLLVFPFVDGVRLFGIPSALPAALNLGLHALWRRRVVRTSGSGSLGSDLRPRRAWTAGRRSQLRQRSRPLSSVASRRSSPRLRGNVGRISQSSNVVPTAQSSAP